MSELPPDIRLGRATIDQIVDLRHKILRQGLPRESAIFPGDDRADARHYAAFAEDGPVCCLTLHASQWEGQPAWQLRGMATASDWQDQGIGNALMDWMEGELQKDPSTSRLLWCNARVPAKRFYEKRGWRVVSEQFDIPTAGPHVRMTKTLQG